MQYLIRSPLCNLVLDILSLFNSNVVYNRIISNDIYHLDVISTISTRFGLSNILRFHTGYDLTVKDRSTYTTLYSVSSEILNKYKGAYYKTRYGNVFVKDILSLLTKLINKHKEYEVYLHTANDNYVDKYTIVIYHTSSKYQVTIYLDMQIVSIYLDKEYIKEQKFREGIRKAFSKLEYSDY